jgi:hypothetical protein
MRHFPFSSRIRNSASNVGLAATVAAGTMAIAVSLAPPVFATTTNVAAASAQAASLKPLNLALLVTPPESASDTGGTPLVVATNTSALSVLGTEPYVTAGALQATATADDAADSSACAGAVGNGASIQVGLTNLCSVVTGGETGGVTLNLGDGNILTATAIVETCSDIGGGTPTATAYFVDATIGSTPIPVNPGVNSSLAGGLLAGLIDTNTQSLSDGVLTASALYIPLLGLHIGTVTCGPNAITGVSSAVPVKSLPIAGGTAALLGGGTFFWYRRRSKVAA